MRNVFFSHHYADAVLAQQVLQCDTCFPDRLSFRDWRAWETVRYKDQTRIRRWIDDQLDGSTVTVVLIGAETAKRYWVKYEIEQTVARGNGLLGIHLNKMRGFKDFSAPRPRGANPFANLPARPPNSRDEEIRKLVDALMAAGATKPVQPPTNWLAAMAAAAPPPPTNWLAAMAGAAPPPCQPNLLAALLRASPPSDGLGLLGEAASSPASGGGLLSDLGFAGSRAPSGGLGLLGEAALSPGLAKWWETPPPLQRTLADETDCYCWDDHKGYYNIAEWIEKAAQAVGK